MNCFFQLLSGNVCTTKMGGQRCELIFVFGCYCFNQVPDVINSLKCREEIHIGHSNIPVEANEILGFIIYKGRNTRRDGEKNRTATKKRLEIMIDRCGQVGKDHLEFT